MANKNPPRVKAYRTPKGSLVTFSLEAKQKTAQVVNESKKSFSFVVKGAPNSAKTVSSVVKKVVNTYALKHDKNAFADGGALTVTHLYTVENDLEATYQIVRAIREAIESEIRLNEIIVNYEKAESEGVSITMSFFDSPMSYKYRHGMHF